jgi:hypothetical protein
MGQWKKVGVILILIGICIPILAMLFAQGYDSRRNLISNAQNIETVFWQEISHPPGLSYRINTIYIPYRYFLALGLILTATGIGLTMLSKNEKGKELMK